jgi:hypothetical protein
MTAGRPLESTMSEYHLLPSLYVSYTCHALSSYWPIFQPSPDECFLLKTAQIASDSGLVATLWNYYPWEMSLHVGFSDLEE